MRGLEEAVLSTTPSPPSSRARGGRPRRIGRDLDNIVLTALRKEPGRRYPSAGALADDIRRLLSGHPVRATRDSVAYRITKLVGRNGATAAATVAGLLLTARSVGWYTVQLRRERAQAQRETAKAQQVADSSRACSSAPIPNPLR